MQRYKFVSGPSWGWLEPHADGDYVKFRDIPPAPEPAPWLDQPDGPGDWKYRAHYMFAGDYLLTRLFLNDKGKLLTRSGTAVSCMNGKWQRMSQVPEPLPWLNQPDGEGWWWFCERNEPVIGRVSKGDGEEYLFSYKSWTQVTRGMTGRWQRIPQPTLPGEDA